MSTVSVYVDIDINDVLHEISDERLLKIVEDRCLQVARTVEEAKIDSFTPLIEEALECLRTGRAADAELVLTRALFPKWSDPETSKRALDELFGRAAA